MAYFLIVIYVIIIILFNILVIKRLKYLSKRHTQNTGIEGLSKGYRIVLRRLIFMTTILIIIVSLLFLTFIKNDLLPKRWIYIDEKTLDNFVF
ncbi:hypothetical protein BLD25_04480 [Candidatus Gracilibacteria bacterium GN02-872]|nr:hypothetical protein BLD25_04480 [Candidatus Gracilibacteria bacterium GN02-872]RKW20772.1 MAG: hypothetical protein D8B46_08815 [Candidatus Gracilibacteria bacterium]